MKKLRVAINGFGRIGRHSFKVAWEKKHHALMDIVAVNDLTDTKTLAHLLKYDTAYPEFPHQVSSDDQHVIVDDTKVMAFAEKEPAKLPWKDLKIDIVIESTGRFTDKAGAGQHLSAGAKRVLISAPGKDEDIQTLVQGVNDETDNGDAIVDNASCTTNCAAPVMFVLEKEFGVEKAMLTTIHSYTADQHLVDGPHKDLRRARAAAANIVPTTTGAAKAVGKTIPSVKGKFDGLSIRVPTLTVSLNDTTAVLKKSVTKEEVNAAFVKASKGYLKGVLAVSDEPLVSSDYVGNPYSATVDLLLTSVVGGNLVKVVAWYDNELGYAHRLIEMVEIVGKKL
jgi:glyceraldehyde 3-phosphate dehydrogenase